MQNQSTKNLSVTYKESGVTTTKSFETLELLEIYLSGLHDRDVEIIAVNRDAGQALTEDVQTVRVLNG